MGASSTRRKEISGIWAGCAGGGIPRIVRIIRKMRGLGMDEDKLRVSAAEFHRNVGHYQDVALVQPVTITKNGRDRTVLISADEYDRLNGRNRKVYAAGETPEYLLEAMRTAEVPAEYNYLNDELKDWKP
jgi:prevent-host-death family protein